MVMSGSAPAAPVCPVDSEGWLPWPVPEGRNIVVESDTIDLSQPDITILSGNVLLRDAEQELAAEKIRYLRPSQRVMADGAVRYRTREIRVEAGRAELELEAETGRLDEVVYRLRDGGGRGRAEFVTLDGQERSSLSQVTYSTCVALDEPDWQLRAREMDLNYATGRGEARGMQLRFKGVPILYLPYASFPLDDRRKSGFLYPSLGSSNDNGIDFALPYYWNIAPNRDATITPRLVTDRGAMLGLEYRYLGARYAGEFSGQYLPDDDLTGRHRALASFRHAGQVGSSLRLDVDLNHVSDRNYFEDFGDSLTTLSRSYLRSTAALTAGGEWWQASVAADAFQVLDRNIAADREPFDRLPVLNFRGARALGGPLELGLDAELVSFDRDQGVKGNRLDLYPELRVPLRHPAYYLEPAIGIRHTAYDLDGAEDTTPDRTTPIASLEGGLFFERDRENGGHQTLEPRFHYLYVPFERQDELPVFDSRELTFGFDQLFRTNRFSGADRQADANQLALAATTRLIDPGGRERFEASIGTIAYFRDQRIQLPDEPERDLNTSAVVGEMHYRPSDFWQATLGVQYDPEDDELDQTLVAVQHRGTAGRILNLAYRQRRGLVRQLDASFLVPVAERWKLVGRANYSFRDDTDLETLLGFEYESCCWAMRAFARRFLRNQDGEHRNGVYLELELKGLGSFGRSTERVLQRAILGYRT